MVIEVTMDRYSAQNAAFKIDGYWNPSPQDKNFISSFERAKQETIQNIEADLENIKSMSFDLYKRYSEYRWRFYNQPIGTDQKCK